MIMMITKRVLFADLRSRIEEHVAGVTATSALRPSSVEPSSGQAVFQPLSDEQLNWQPDPKEWSILQCFDHLNLTHEYYRPKIELALQKEQERKDKETELLKFYHRFHVQFIWYNSSTLFLVIS